MTCHSSKEARHSVVELLNQRHDKLDVISSDYEADEDGKEQSASHHFEDSDELEDEVEDIDLQIPHMPGPPSHCIQKTKEAQSG